MPIEAVVFADEKVGNCAASRRRSTTVFTAGGSRGHVPSAKRRVPPPTLGIPVRSRARAHPLALFPSLVPSPPDSTLAMADEPTDADKLPVTIVTGFLGAGKTTLVNLSLIHI